MSVYKRTGAVEYCYDFVREGRRFSGLTGETELRRAQAVERKIKTEVEAALRSGRRSLILGLTLDKAAARYWDEIGQRTAEPEKLAAELERLVLLVGPDTILRNIGDNLLAEAIAKRRLDFVRGDPKRGRISSAHVNRSTTQLLRRILSRARTAWKEQLPEEPNWRAHMLKEPKAVIRELRHDEEMRLEAVERDDYQKPRLFAQITGLRRREVAGLAWTQIDFDGETISVVGKGDKPHVLPMTAELRELLEPLRGHHATAVFTYVAQKNRRCPRTKQTFKAGQRYPITYEGLGTHLGRTFKRAGLKGFRIHDLRHTAATRTLRATGNLRLVQQLLAHSSPAVTAKYAHATLDDIREGMSKAAAESAARKAMARTKAAASVALETSEVLS